MLRTSLTHRVLARGRRKGFVSTPMSASMENTSMALQIHSLVLFINVISIPPYSFYDNSGALNVDKLEEELGNKHHVNENVTNNFNY